MYKLILVASAVNAASETHDNTASLVNNLCTLIDFAPDAVPMLLEQATKDYAPKIVSSVFHRKDFDIGNKSAHQMCVDYKAGKGLWASIKNQGNVIVENGVGTLAEKGAAIALGEDSALARAAGEFTKKFAAGDLDTQVQKAKAFVDLIVEAENDPKTSFSFESVLSKDDAARMATTLESVKGRLQNAVTNKEETFECGSPIYNELKELTKNGLYDELLAKSNSIFGDDAKSSAINTMLKKVMVRTTVSKGISFFADCPGAGARILLA